MTQTLSRLGAMCLSMLISAAAFATPGNIPHGPPAGIPMGPPAAIPAGPPSGVPKGPPNVPARPPVAAVAHVPQGVGKGKPAGVPVGASTAAANASAFGRAKLDANLSDGAAQLGKLNAAHASENGLARASSKSVVGALAIYRDATLDARGDIAALSKLIVTDESKITLDEKAVADAQGALTAAEGASTPDQAAIDKAQTALTAAKSTLTSDQQLLAAHQSDLADARQAVLSAQTTLAASTKTTLSPEKVAALDKLLGI